MSEPALSPWLWRMTVMLWGAAVDPCPPQEGWLQVKSTADFPRTSKEHLWFSKGAASESETSRIEQTC